MATTTFREDYLGRDIGAPTVTAVDHLGRLTTATADSKGRALFRSLRVNSTAYTLGASLSFVDGKKFTVTVAGTTAAAEPAAPAVGATVADGTATLSRTK